MKCYYCNINLSSSVFYTRQFVVNWHDCNWSFSLPKQLATRVLSHLQCFLTRSTRLRFSSANFVFTWQAPSVEQLLCRQLPQKDGKYRKWEVKCKAMAPLLHVPTRENLYLKHMMLSSQTLRVYSRVEGWGHQLWIAETLGIGPHHECSQK